MGRPAPGPGRFVPIAEPSNIVPASGPPLFGAADRRALRAVGTQFFVNGAVVASFMPRMPEIRDRVDISIATVGLLLSLAGLSGLVGSAAAGRAISRFGTRAVILASGTVVAISLAVVGVARLPAVLLLGLIGISAFDVPVDVGMNMQGSWLSARRHAPVMNRLHGLWSLGTLVGGLISSRIAAAGISLSLHLVAAAGILLAVTAYLGRGLLPVDEVATGSPAVAGPPTGRPSRAGPVLVLFGLAGFFALAMEATSIDWAAFRLRDDFGTSAGFAALGYVAVTGGMTAARFGGDWAAARLGDHRLTTLSVAVTGAGLAVASLAPDRHLALAGYVAAGAGVATLLPMLYDTAAKHPGSPGAGLGALTGGLRLGSLGIPVLVGVLAGADVGLGVGGAVAVVTLPSAACFLLVSTQLRARTDAARTDAGRPDATRSDGDGP